MYKIGTVIAWFNKSDNGKPFDIDIILSKDFFDDKSFISQSLINYNNLGGIYKLNFDEKIANHRILFYWEV